MEVAPTANPPVAKIIDFKKFKYLEAKKEKEAKKSAHEQEVKEIRLGPFTAKGDLEIRIKKAREFLTHRDRVKISIIFHGREITRKEFGYEMINKITSSLSDVAKVERSPKMEGKQLTAILAPIK